MSSEDKKSVQTKCRSCGMWTCFYGLCENYTCTAYDEGKIREHNKKRRLEQRDAAALAAKGTEE